jgi:hypothetical protein
MTMHNELLAVLVIIIAACAWVAGHATGHARGRRNGAWERELDRADTWTRGAEPETQWPQGEIIVPERRIAVSDDTQAWLDGLPSRVDAVIHSWSGNKEAEEEAGKR